MAKINILETKYETFLRTRAEDVCHLYLAWSHEIMNGQVKPNRVIQTIAIKKGMSGEGVKTILKRHGLYKSASEPIVLPKVESTNLSSYRAEMPALASL